MKRDSFPLIRLGARWQPGGEEATLRLARACGIKPWARVLALGLGGEIPCLLTRHFQAMATGFLPDAGLEEQARQTCGRALQDATRVLFLSGDPLKLPFDSEVFEAVFSDALNPPALPEIRRVLAPKGRLALALLVPKTALPSATHEALGRFIGMSFLPLEEWRTLLEREGFRILRQEEGAPGMPLSVEGGFLKSFSLDPALKEGMKAFKTLWGKEKGSFALALIVAERP